MNENEMFEKSFQRTKNYFYLTGPEKYEIDNKLGLVDWSIDKLTDEDKQKFFAHYEVR